MSSLLSFMNNSHRNRSDRKQSTVVNDSMYSRKDMVVSTTGNLALPTLKSSSKIPISLSAALSKGSTREGLPSVNANNSSSMRSILSPREISSSKVEAQSTLRSSAMALLTSSSSDAAAALSQSNIPLSIKQRQIAPSNSTSGYTTRASPRSSFSNGLLTTISNNIIGRSTSSIKENASSVSTTCDNNPSSLVCDKCDGKHTTEKCPHFKKERDSHPDAQKNFYQKLGGSKSALPGQMITRANIIRQPGDGSCLFHSMSYGLGGDATKLRSEICSFISANPDFKICETPLSDWIRWDSNCSPADYSRKMSRGSWGGGIEMACTSVIKKCNIHVYEKHLGNFKRISAFDYPDNPEQKKVVRVLYQGGVHYDALQTN